MAQDNVIEFGQRRRLRRKDRQAQEFARLYQENFTHVYNYVRYLVTDRTVAEDVTSEAFLKAARSFDRFDASKAKFSTWVIAIARNCAFDYFDKHKPTADLEEIPEGAYSSEEDFAQNLADADLVERLLQLLETDEREMVFLKYYEGRRNTEIAELLGMNQSTVSTKLSRAMAKMRAVAEEGQ